MSSIAVQALTTLDGVVQAAGGPDEDREGGFEHGGWQSAYEGGEDIVEEGEGRTEALLLGLRPTTYDLFSSSWGVWDENSPGTMGEFTQRQQPHPEVCRVAHADQARREEQPPAR